MRSAPDPMKLHPVPGEDRVVFLKPLVTGCYCAIASKLRFLSGGNHADLGPSTFPFGIFGEPWAERTMDLAMSAPSRGDTVVGNDVGLGYGALVLAGVKIGRGAVVAAGSVVAADVPPYAIVAGNPARVVEHARTIMAGKPVDLERIANGARAE